jgi:hypothetical protein
MSETWKPIPDWPGYEVSDLGNVRSYWGPGGRGHGRRALVDTSKLVGNYKVRSGHRTAVLYRGVSREKRTAGVHVLVLETFVGPRPSGAFACHKNGDPADNRLANLRWDTPSANVIDTLKHGTHAQSKLDEQTVKRVWKSIGSGKKDSEIAREHGVSPASVHGIKYRLRWKHITTSMPGGRERPSRAGEPIYPDSDLTRSPKEIWRPVEGWAGYRVSSRGRVQTCKEIVRGGKRGEFALTDQWKDRRLSTDAYGYKVVGFYEPSRYKMMKVHRLVLEAFVCPQPEGMVACHCNGDRSDNRLINLRWDYQKANAIEREYHRKRRATR